MSKRRRAALLRIVNSMDKYDFTLEEINNEIIEDFDK